jgi:anti-sigma regulatory factor (Ser/Thr protein kinase)
MRTGAATGREGFVHEALYYGSDEEFLSVAVPFLRDGVAAGEPAMAVLGEHNAALVRSALPRSARVEYTSGSDMYARPAGAIRAYRQYLAERVAAGARRIRVIDELPPEAAGATWDAWARYESAVNRAYQQFPLWSLCSYDRRTATAKMLHDVARTHPRKIRPDGSHPAGPPYTRPETFLSEPHDAPPDPLESTPPAAELLGPTPAQARRAVRCADPGEVPAAEVADLVLAVSEAVTNAILHGRPPIRVRVWCGGDRLVAAVSDGGPGPRDPYAGLLPVAGSPDGGRGLWIIQQACDHVVLRHDVDGFTLRLSVGRMHLPLSRQGVYAGERDS